LEGYVNIFWPFPGLFRRPLWRNLIVGFVPAFAKTAKIKRQNVKARSGQLLRQAVPNLAFMVALVQ
jgi:hypothetical protein